MAKATFDLKNEANKRELVDFLKNNMTIEVEGGGGYNPNEKTIILRVAGEEICKGNFNVVQKREYEG